MALATVEQLQARPGLSELADPSAQALLDEATGLVQQASDQTFEFVANDRAILRGYGTSIRLPQGPVVVDEQHPLTVTQRTAMIGGAGTAAVRGVHFELLGEQLVRDVPWGRWVEVVYSHGYQEPPAWLSTLVVDVAVAVRTGATTVDSTGPVLQSRQVGQIRDTYATRTSSDQVALLDSIRARLQRLGILRGGGAFSIAPS